MLRSCCCACVCVCVCVYVHTRARVEDRTPRVGLNQLFLKGPDVKGAACVGQEAKLKLLHRYLHLKCSHLKT